VSEVIPEDPDRDDESAMPEEADEDTGDE